MRAWVATLLTRVIGKNVKFLRRQAQPRLTQDELAARASVHRNTIINLEKGTLQSLTVATLEAIASALGVSVESLVVEQVKALDPRVQKSLEVFVNSGLEKVRPHEEAELRRSAMAAGWGPLTPKGWMLALEIARSQNAFKESGEDDAM